MQYYYSHKIIYYIICKFCASIHVSEQWALHAVLQASLAQLVWGMAAQQQCPPPHGWQGFLNKPEHH